MDRKTLTRQDISEALYRHIGLSKHESALMLEFVLRQISNSLIIGESVKLSSFGTFHPRQKKERVGRNPKTGKIVKVAPKKVPFFKVGKQLKEMVDAGKDKYVIREA